ISRSGGATAPSGALRPGRRLRGDPPEDERRCETARVSTRCDAAGVGACRVQAVDRRAVLAKDARPPVDLYAPDRLRDPGPDVDGLPVAGRHLDAGVVRPPPRPPRLSRRLDHLADTATAELDFEGVLVD